MLGTLTCALVRTFGGRHDWLRKELRDGSSVLNYDGIGSALIGPSSYRQCRRCGTVVPIKRRKKS